MGKTVRYDDESSKASGRPKGSVMTVSFSLNDHEFVALNGGPIFKFNEAISIIVNCDTQKEVDDYWSKLTKGGQEVQCGWLKDKFGLSWQINPNILDKMIADKNAKKSQNVMKAMLGMKKIIIKDLQKAYDAA